MTKIWYIRAATVFSVLIAITSYRFLFLPLELGFPDFGEHILKRQTWFVLHIAASPIALAIGGFQFMPRLRAKRPALHRWFGRTYALAILAGGISGIVIGVTAIGGPIAQVGFTALAVLWLGTTAMAVMFAMQRKLSQHRKWMIYSFALTFAAVTLRIQLPFFFAGGFDYQAASVWVAWTCWVPNLIFATWYLGCNPGLPNA